MTRNLIVLVGAPGSGKTTWARHNGSNAIHVSQDDLIDAITPHGFDHLYRPIYHEAEDAIARAGLRTNRIVIVDRTNRTRAHRERWLQLAREEAAPAIAVVMTASQQLCRERNAKRENARRLTETRMERMFQALEPVQPNEGFLEIYPDSITLEEILARKEQQTYEYCHQTR